ncbi:hypothetical protein [Aeromonas caviae]|uniref:hypothetical protein n=1 Tax=Aeromonas caviae TaxID=648 RepID=UPI00114C97A9|nr:hypothetical protein [Aeromonas caviae]
MSTHEMNEMSELVRRVALAFVAECGPYFLSEGHQRAPNIALPLTLEKLSETLHNMVVEQAGSVYGEAFSLTVLCNSLDGDALSNTGFSLVCALLEEVCDDLRQMLAEGKDPEVEIARMRREREAGATS